MNIYENTTTRDAAILLEFQEPDQINGSPGPPGYNSTSQPNLSTPEGEPQFSSSKGSIFTFSYYQEFFNVNTQDVLHKVKRALMPNFQSNYFEDCVKSKADLYGPVWICVTLSFAIAISSNFLDFLNSDEHWKYEFHLITKASLIVFVYAWIVPIILWSLIKWYLASQMPVSAVELICIYGYCLVVYIPLSFLWIINYHYLQVIFLLIAMCTSGIVLLSSIEPMLNNRNYAVVGGVVFFHIFFSIIVYFSFFYIKAVEEIVPETKSTTLPPQSLHS